MSWSKILDYVCALVERNEIADIAGKVVYVVIKQVDQGQVMLVSSSQAKATQYIANNPYSGFIMVERQIDKPES
jgi:hypothetical protein